MTVKADADRKVDATISALSGAMMVIDNYWLIIGCIVLYSIVLYLM